MDLLRKSGEFFVMKEDLDDQAEAAKEKFKSHPIGYFHIDIAEVQTAEGKHLIYNAVRRVGTSDTDGRLYRQQRQWQDDAHRTDTAAAAASRHEGFCT